ncbi:MAG: hypothetical protein LBI44_07865 [Oscillospiraceae bacterium]|jgi:hypothetical protein|nr:hypothetical protein [Oscillospiraceae bacterium]
MKRLTISRTYSIIEKEKKKGDCCVMKDVMNPENYEGMSFLSEDMREYCRLYELCKMEDSQENRFALERQWETLYFCVKHRLLEGYITQEVANEIRERMDEMCYD